MIIHPLRRRADQYDALGVSPAAGRAAPGTPGPGSPAPSDRQPLHDDDLDSAGGTVRVGSYAFLTDAGDLTSGATTVVGVSGAAALLLNSHGYVDRDYTSALGTVEVGDRVTWFPGTGSCWFHDRVTEILIDPPRPRAS